MLFRMKQTPGSPGLHSAWALPTPARESGLVSGHWPSLKEAVQLTLLIKGTEPQDDTHGLILMTYKAKGSFSPAW